VSVRPRATGEKDRRAATARRIAAGSAVAGSRRRLCNAVPGPAGTHRRGTAAAAIADAVAPAGCGLRAAGPAGAAAAAVVDPPAGRRGDRGGVQLGGTA